MKCGIKKGDIGRKNKSANVYGKMYMHKYICINMGLITLGSDVK